jgi:hypothetical protein
MGPYGPGGGSIGVRVTDLEAENARLQGLGCDADDVMTAPGAPRLFMMRDPDGNNIAVVEEPAA